MRDSQSLFEPMMFTIKTIRSSAILKIFNIATFLNSIEAWCMLDLRKRFLPNGLPPVCWVLDECENLTNSSSFTFSMII